VGDKSLDGNGINEDVIAVIFGSMMEIDASSDG
jgi:hypothetical protein